MNKIIKWLFFCLVFFTAVSNVWIVYESRPYLFTDIDRLEYAEVGLVLGTSNQLKGGAPNPFFEKRIEAAAKLLRSKKVGRLLLSGSRDSVYYDEAEMMKVALMRMGIQESQLILDKLGDRTLNSLQRLRMVHGYSNCTIVTQSNHAYRAVFIARHYGLDAKCYVAEPPSVNRHFVVILRELLARPKAIIDIYILGL